MSEQRKVPKLRFPEFTDDWEQRKFGDTIQERREKSTKENEDTLLSCAINGIFLNSDLFSHFRGSSNIGYLKIRKNDLILSAQNLHLGNCNVNLTYDHGIVSPAYKVYELVNCYPYFMQAWVKKDCTKQFFLKAATEGASVCRKNIVWEDLYKQNILIPSYEEQVLIGDYFYKIDNLITLHQRKCEVFKKLKKGLLQKMFPKDGTNIPEIRFPEFTDAWEQRKFGDTIQERREKSTKENEDTLLSCAINGIFLNSDLFSHFRGSSNIGYLKIRKNDLILSAQNLHLGNCNVNLTYDHGIVSPAYKVYELVNCYPYFMQAWVKKDCTKQFFLKAATEGASVCRKNIVWEDLYKQNILIPSYEEQVLIGDYFYKIDNLITLHQRKLEVLKKLKKGLLQQMFV